MYVLSNDAKRNNQAYDEIDIIRRANHENILKYYGQYNQHNSLYLITEYCEVVSFIKEKYITQFEEIKLKKKGWRFGPSY